MLLSNPPGAGRERVQIERGETEWGTWERASRSPDSRLGGMLSRGYVGSLHDSMRFEHWLEPPPAALTLMVSLGDPLQTQRGTLPRAWIAGLDDRPELVETGGRQELIDIKLTPLGARTLCGLPLREFPRAPAAWRRHGR